MPSKRATETGCAHFTVLGNKLRSALRAQAFLGVLHGRQLGRAGAHGETPEGWGRVACSRQMWCCRAHDGVNSPQSY